MLIVERAADDPRVSGDHAAALVRDDAPIIRQHVGLRGQPADQDFAVGRLHGDAGQDFNRTAILLGKRLVARRPEVSRWQRWAFR